MSVCTTRGRLVGDSKGGGDSTPLAETPTTSDSGFEFSATTSEVGEAAFVSSSSSGCFGQSKIDDAIRE